MDMDDTAWKHVCDAARNEMRNETRYKQTKQQMDKARERVSSVEQVSVSGSGDSSDAPQSPPPTRDRVTRAFFKGGEAMKKLQEKALVQIAKTTLSEGEQKEEKDQIALEEATAAKNRAIVAYKNYTSERIEKIDSSDKAGWNEMKVSVNDLVASTKSLREARNTIFEQLLTEEISSSIQSLPADAEEWLAVARKTILQNNPSTVSAATDAGEEYALTIKGARTKNVKKLLEMNGLEVALPQMAMNEPVEDRPIEAVNDKNSCSSDGAAHSDSGIVLRHSTRKFERASTAPVGIKVDDDEKARDDESQRIVSENQPGHATDDSSELSLAMKAFVKQFWSKKSENEKPPEILQLISCSYRSKEKTSFLTPPMHGKLYTTKERIYFLSLDNKNFVLSWKEIVSVQKEKGFMGASNENAVAITYGSGSSFTLGHLESRNSVLSHLQNLHEESQTEKPPVVSEMPRSENSGQLLPPVRPDALLKDMEIVVSKTIKNVSINSLFQKVWADDSPDQASFYETWLNEEECFDISVPAWEFSDPGTEIKNAWCGETYTQQRLVTFRFNRTSHLYIGPPVAYVKQRQFVRVEGNDKCIMMISATFEGIPYSDCFGVEMRWVARRKGNNDVQVDVGLFVLFKKSTMLKSQIKAGTISETKNVHLRLFDAVKRACTVPGETQAQVGGDIEEEAEEVEEVEPQKGPLNKLRSILGVDSSVIVVAGIGVLCFLFLLNRMFGRSTSDFRRLESRIDELQDDIRALKQAMEIVIELLKEKNI
jgi:VAD1 Analog of StAR-related lipid transfer domain/GRAM domain